MTRINWSKERFIFMAIKNKLITGANFRDFDWNKAKLFYHIAKCGSLLKAAQVSGIDQSTLTRQMQALEKQIGCPLLIRQSTGITLTRKGEELLQKVAHFFLEVKGFCGNNHVEIEGEKKRKIRIATTHAIGTYIINDLLIQYNIEHQNLSFELVVNDKSIDVILDDVDIAIRPFDPTTETVHQSLLFTLEKKMYASAKYIERYGEPTTIDDLSHHQLLTYPVSMDYPYSDTSWILKVGMPEGKFRKPFFTSNSVECLVEAAKNNIGIMSGYEQMKIFRDSGLKIILPTIKSKPTKEYIIYPAYLKEDPEIIGLEKYLKTKLTTND